MDISKLSNAREVVLAYGHKNVQATHKSTLEITKDRQLSKKGDCIVAVKANKGLADFSRDFKRSLQKEDAKLRMLIEVGKIGEVINGYGSTQLIMTHPTNIVLRKSRYVCCRTLAIQADKAACDLSRKLLEKLRNPEQTVKITLTVEA